MAFRVFIEKNENKKNTKKHKKKEQKRRKSGKEAKNLRSQNNLLADVSSNQRKPSDSERVLICREESVAIDV